MRHTVFILSAAVAIAAVSTTHAQQPRVAQTQAQAAAPLSQTALDATVAMYAAAWGDADLASRRRLLERVWADKGTYTDPTVQLQGREALVQHISTFLDKLPGARIVPTTHVDAHHNGFRFGWRIVSASGTALSEGLDYGELDATGRITRIVGFFGPIEPMVKDPP